MMPEYLEPDERKYLLELARQSITLAVQNKPLPQLDLTNLSPMLKQKGATFVTLTEDGVLRGCIGTLTPFQPLVEDVQDHAVAAALQDYRFPPVQARDLPKIHIEISRLTIPQPLNYKDPQELLTLLKPRVDGVILKNGLRQATFLPQVWDQLPQPRIFLAHLCQKMGASSDLWEIRHLEVSIYQVEEFQE
jgi:uncharacterized protein